MLCYGHRIRERRAQSKHESLSLLRVGFSLPCPLSSGALYEVQMGLSHSVQ